jgi:hypothetical protein
VVTPDGIDARAAFRCASRTERVPVVLLVVESTETDTGHWRAAVAVRVTLFALPSTGDLKLEQDNLVLI